MSIELTLDSRGICLISGNRKSKKLMKKTIKKIKKDFKESEKCAIQRLTHFLFLESADFNHYCFQYDFSNRGIYGGLLINAKFKNNSDLKSFISELFF